MGCYRSCMWQRVRDFLTWKWGVLIGVVLIVLGQFLAALASDPNYARTGDGTVNLGKLVLIIAAIAGINAGVKAANRRKTSELPR